MGHLMVHESESASKASVGSAARSKDHYRGRHVKSNIGKNNNILANQDIKYLNNSFYRGQLEAM